MGRPKNPNYKPFCAEEMFEAKRNAPNVPVKMYGTGGKYNFPSTVPPEEPELVKKVLKECFNWFKIGLNPCKDDQEVAERTVYFLTYCIENNERPTVEKYCLCLGYEHRTVNSWENGVNCSKNRTRCIKMCLEFLAAYDAHMVTAGALRDVPYIFRAKNFYHMTDQTDLHVIQDTPVSQFDKTAEEIATEYAELPD